MNIESEKLKLISWLALTNDPELINQISKLKESLKRKKTFKRKFGCDKGIVTFIAEDFTEPLEEFREYTR